MSSFESFPETFGESPQPPLVWDPISGKYCSADEVSIDNIGGAPRLMESLTEDQFPAPLTFDPEAF